MSFSYKQIILPLKVTWSIARSSDNFKRNYILYWDNKPIAEIAPNLRYGEELGEVEKQLD